MKLASPRHSSCHPLFLGEASLSVKLLESGCCGVKLASPRCPSWYKLFLGEAGLSVELWVRTVAVKLASPLWSEPVLTLASECCRIAGRACDVYLGTFVRTLAGRTRGLVPPPLGPL